MNILLGITGSVAVSRLTEIYTALLKLGQVKIVATESACRLVTESGLGLPILRDKDEAGWSSGKILHIALRDWADCMIIAPCTMNTLAKISSGQCDNLLTEVVRAWDNTKKLFIVPAANTYMWNNPITSKNIENIKSCYNSVFINPIIGKLVCGDTGLGKIANTATIVAAVENETKLARPLSSIPGIPVGDHPGSFGYKRSYYFHPGVDLYTHENAPVFACEDGVVLLRAQFTGPPDHKHWLKTEGLVIKGRHIINYGEITSNFNPGAKVYKGQIIGRVTPVLPPEKLRPDIPGHSCSMLHFEMYSEFKEFADWKTEKPAGLLDPTETLKKIYGGPLLSLNESVTL